MSQLVGRLNALKTVARSLARCGPAPVVCLFGTIPSERRTSMEAYARHLAAALRALETPVHLYTPPDGRLRSAAARYWHRYGRYQLAARSLNADINHIVDHGYGHLVFSLDAARTIVTFHDAMLLKLADRALPTEFQPRVTILGHRLSLAGITRAARVIADSESARADLLAHTGIAPERVSVIPLGVEPRFFIGNQASGPSGNGDRRHAGHSKGARLYAPTILHVGSCAFYKNLETILHALPVAMRLLGEPITFLKAGAPFTPEQEALIVHLGIESQVRHLGFIPDADLPILYRRADALVFPSLYEGFGLPVLEAMASGMPVITSNAGSLPEVAGDAALMIDATNRDGLAAAIAQVLGNPTLHADLAHRGVQRAAQFSWHETARRTLAVYQEVLHEAGRLKLEVGGRAPLPQRQYEMPNEHACHRPTARGTEEVKL